MELQRPAHQGSRGTYPAALHAACMLLPLLFLRPFLLGALLLPTSSRTPPYNPILVWQLRLRPTPDLLVLPPAQRGLRTQQTVLQYQGKDYLLQQAYYSRRGLLDSCLTYDLAQVHDSLVSYLHLRTHYHTQRRGHTLVSQRQQQWLPFDPATPADSWARRRTTHQLTGEVPPTEPFLGPHAPAFSPGTLLETSRLDTARWSWQLDEDVRFVLSHRPHNQPLGYTDWETWLDLSSQTLRFTNGHGLNYVRHYLHGGPDYEEQCESASVIVGSGGATLRSTPYTRTTHWQAGRCQREHFVVPEVTLAEGHPEFDVIHTYTFYRRAQATLN